MVSQSAHKTPDDFPLTTSVIHQLPDVAGEAQFELGLAALAHGLLRQPRHSPETPCHALPRMRQPAENGLGEPPVISGAEQR